MDYIKDLFLQKIENPTILANEQEHTYRHHHSENGFVSTPLLPKLDKKECTIGNVWEKTAAAYDNKPAFGNRKLIKIHTKEMPAKDGKKAKKWSMFELDEYKWKSYKEVNKQIQSVASALQSSGLQHGDIFLLYCKTRAEWMIAALASLTLGLVITTAYDSMPADAVTHIIKETKAKAVFTETALLRTLNKAYKDLEKTEQPKLVVYTGEEFEAPEEVNSFKENKADDVEILYYNDIKDGEIKSGYQAPKPDDLALIMYTSGSTGAPKGVELTHANIIAAMGAAEHLAVDFLTDQKHTYIGFLPLAHVLEFILEFIMIATGIPIGYGTMRTLMDDSVCGPNGQGKAMGDLKSLRPTIMAGVPAVWEKIRKGVDAQLQKQHWVVRQAFYAAIEAKWQMLNFFGKSNILTNTYDSILFRQISEVTGGNLKYGLSGGAPVSFETQKFVTSTLCFLLQGYGLTECCGLAAVTLPSLGPVTGIIGPPSPSIEFRFVDVPDTDYKAKNNIGELWLRGPSLMKGYYKRQDLTQEALTPDGWFKTGDIAKLNSDGTFAITDRVKNLVKLAHGEYIALENLESKYRNTAAIKNICLVADSNKSYIIGIVEPSDSSADKESLLKDLQNTASSSGCSRVETIKDIIVTKDRDWAKDLMTTSGKVKRNSVLDAYKDEIEKIYK